MFYQLIAAIVLFSTSAFAQNLTLEFSAIEKGSLLAMTAPKERIIHETPEHYLVKSALTNFASYDYYFVQLPNNPEASQWLSQNTKVAFIQPNKFVILQISNEKELFAVASRVHHEAGACGMIQKLSDQPIDSLNFEPTPLIAEAREDIQEIIQDVDVDNVLNSINTMVSWKSRYHKNQYGLETAPQLLDMYRDLTPADRTDVTYELIKHRSTPQESFIVRIYGTTSPEKINILGSHIDSINSRDKNDAPGADDNASGTATNLEVFRVIMKHGIRPQETIEFHGYAAEEIGLVGSGEMADDYKRLGKQVEAMVQFDMNGFTSSDAKITFVSNGTTSSLNRSLKHLVDSYLKVPSSSGYLFMGSSDHASWKKRGFPVSFPTENPNSFNRQIHTKNDTMKYLNSPKQIEAFAQLGVAYLIHFAGWSK